MLLLSLLFLLPLTLAGPVCSLGGDNVSPSQVLLSSMVPHHGVENCRDQRDGTLCQTTLENNPFLVMQFKEPVEVLGVYVKTTEKEDMLTVRVTNEAPGEEEVVSSGKTLSMSDASEEDLLIFSPPNQPHKPRAGMEGMFVVIQKKGNNTTLSMDEVEVCAEHLGYIPGDPGGPWDPVEIDIVQQKLRYLFRRSVRTNKTDIITDEMFPPIVNEVWTAGFEYKRNITHYRRNIVLGFHTRKVIQLAFHDCLKYEDGSGGCDGCLNWTGMDDLHEEPPNNMGTVREGEPHYRVDPIQRETDNNRLSTSAMVLEWIYREPSWPPGAPSLGQSLRSTGKSRADLWQLAANVALEIELIKANWGCYNRNNYDRQVTILEGLDKCIVKLHKPVPFQHGRRDCVQDPHLMTTEYPFEATKDEHHPNPHGSGESVLRMMKDEFGISGSQLIALMAVHGLAPQHHNTNLKNQYRWPGNPFLSNMYHKALANRPLYMTGSWLNEGPWDAAHTSTLIGDKDGNPIHGDIQGGLTFECKMFWNTSNPDSGPCFFRPLNVNLKGMSKDHPEWLPRTECFKWDFDNSTYEKQSGLECDTASIDPKTGVQKGGEPNYWWNIDRPSHSLAFFLVFEANFVNNFTVDDENHPRGCNIPDQLTELDGWGKMDYRDPISCGPNNFRLPGESMSSTEITEALADDHDLWEQEFLDGWAQLQKNGYGDGLINGPENSWLGYSLVPEGSPIEFPLEFGQDMDPDADPSEFYITYRGHRNPGGPPETHEVVD